MARIRKPKTWLIAAVIALVAFPMSWALADEFDANSSVSINHSGNGFGGHVSSNRGRCLRRRTVRLIKVRKHKRNRQVGSDATNRNGHYSIPKRNPHGRYKVKVVRRLQTRYGHRHDCGGASSRTIRVD